ncbi:coiled-coil domain-containing protein 86 [Arctopsyche grandis]|uniref:coiled-coil domain-containing protein 86 n=1 Tax=Arctopsyche grandis TaxID=121162 RepID=UPI00406D8679
MTKTQDKVKNILSTLKKNPTTETTTAIDVEKSNVVNVQVEKKSQDIPRGRPKSGRIWKSPKQKFSSVKKTKGAHQKFEEKNKLRQQLKETMETSKALRAEKQAQKEAHKQRRRDNIKKTEENRLKSEIVQVITNSAKVKRMKKKQLKFIEKRDTTKVSK